MECGAPLESDCGFWAKCGKTVKTITTTPSAPASSGEPRARVSLPAQKRMKILAVIIIVVLVVGVLFGTGLIQNFFKPPFYSVNGSVKPFQALIRDMGIGPRPLAALQDSRGNTVSFVSNEVLYAPSSPGELSAFLTRYGGKIIANSSTPPPPPGLKGTREIKPEPLAYTIRLDPSSFSLRNFDEDATKAGVANETVKFSSDNGAKLMALVLHELANGADIAPNYVAQPTGAFMYQAQTSTSNNLGDGQNPMEWLEFNDTSPVDYPRVSNPPTPPQSVRTGSNVYKAWQFVIAHGFNYRPKIAIIDGGFGVDMSGYAMPGSDLPQHPWQYTFPHGQQFCANGATSCSPYIASGPNPLECEGSPCPMHGQVTASIATGFMDMHGSSRNAPGVGGLVADPILFLADGTGDAAAKAVKTAISWGADIISMSFGFDCGSAGSYWCRHTSWGQGGSQSFAHALDKAYDAGLLLVAAAGNTGKDVQSMFPCYYKHVLCVGSLTQGSSMPNQGDSRGPVIGIYAPDGIHVYNVGADDDIYSLLPPSQLSCGTSPCGNLALSWGTSESTPFVAGVAALMKAVNPKLNGDKIAGIIGGTAYGGPADPAQMVDRVIDPRKDAKGDYGWSIRRLNAFANVVAATCPNWDWNYRPGSWGDWQSCYHLAPDVHIAYPAHGASINPNGNFNGRYVGTFEAWAYDIFDSDTANIPYGPIYVGGNPMRDNTYNTSPPPHNLPSWAQTEPSQYSWSAQAAQGIPPPPSSAPPLAGSGYVQPDPNKAFPLKPPWVTMAYYDFTQQQNQQQDYVVVVEATNSHHGAGSDSIRVHVGFANNPPQPVITQPSSSSWSEVAAELGLVTAYPAGVQLMLQGYGKSTDPGEFGWTPCDHMEFSGAGANTFQQTPTATVDHQQTGVCQTLVSFPDPGAQVITLDAWNQFKQHGQARVRIELVEQSSQSSSSSSSSSSSHPGQSNPTSEFDFDITPIPTAVVTQGSSVTVSVTIQVTPGSTTSATVNLNVPTTLQGSTLSLNPTSGVPAFQSILTIKTSVFTVAKTYTITIKGSGGGLTRTQTVTIEVLSVPH